VLFIYIYITRLASNEIFLPSNKIHREVGTRLASNEIFLPSNKIHREVGRAKDLSSPLVMLPAWMDTWRYIPYLSLLSLLCTFRIYFRYTSNLAVLSLCVMTAHGVKSVRYLCLQVMNTFVLFPNFYHMYRFYIN